MNDETLAKARKWLEERHAAHPLTARQQLDNLADALADDILATPDDVWEAEAVEDGVDLDQSAAEFQAIFERTLTELAKEDDAGG